MDENCVERLKNLTDGHLCSVVCAFTEAAHSSSTNVLQLSGRTGVEVKVEVRVECLSQLQAQDELRLIVTTSH